MSPQNLKKGHMCIRFGRILYYVFVLKYTILDEILISVHCQKNSYCSG